MKNFKVLVEYPAFATYEIVANSAEEAIAKAKALDEGDETLKTSSLISMLKQSSAS